MCLMPFFCRNDLNSLLMNLDSLSVTTISGRPCEANVVSFSMVMLEVAEFTSFRMCINNKEKHLAHERASVIYRYSGPRAARPFPRVQR